MRSRSHPDHSNPRNRRLTLVAAAAISALGLGVIAAPAAQAADPVVIDLVTINDLHGRIEASAPAGGMAALATAVNGIRAANPNTVFAAAGDLIGASTFTSFIQQDKPTIDTLNAAGLEVSAVGNHEFDQGWADLRDRVQGLADWEYLSANVWDTETDASALPEYWTKTMDGVTVGFIGAVTEELPSLVSPAGIATLEVRDIVENVNRVADQLTDDDAANGEADVIVLLIHEGASEPTLASATDPASPFGVVVNGASDKINAIVSGHTHLAYDLEVPYGGATGLRPVISAGQYGERFSNMKIEVDPDTKELLSMDNAIYDMWTFPPRVPPAPAPDPIPNYAADPAVQQLVDDAVAFAAVEGSKPVGVIDADFNRGLQPVPVTPQTPTGIGEARGAESTLGNFVADVQLWAAQRRSPDIQIALMNPGGLRANLAYAGSSAADPDGNVTFAEAAGVQPFANTLVTMTLTGSQLTQALEEQWQPAAASRPFLKLGVSEGLTYVTDYAAPAGSRVTNVKLDGVPINLDAPYRVVVNSFLASGGDNFVALRGGTARADSGEVDLQAMVDWFEANGEAVPDLAQRSIGVTLPAPGANGYLAGSTIQVDLSSLDFTTNETPASEVTVSFDGGSQSSAPIDRSLVALTDQAGTATVQATIPATARGTVLMSISTTTGTSFEVPIAVFAPVKSTTIGWPSKIFAKKGSALSYTVVVAAKGQVPTGEVTIRDGSKAIATATLTAAHKGRVTVALPALSKGLHRLSAAYEGTELIKPSASVRLPVYIW